MNCIKRNFPNAITCVNVLAGTAAIMAMLHSDASLWGLGALQWAWILVGVAAVADFLDGFAACLGRLFGLRLGARLAV
mgnify:CR=1 FL=1